MPISKEPKYDNDFVTLGYLNKTINKENKNNDQKINTIPKNYNSPPIPPYYANSLLLLDGQIYKCIKSRLTGSFTMSDWKIVVATDDISEALKAIYDVNKLEYVSQSDGIIETFYQSEDPSLNWQTDLDKDKHTSDLWSNGSECYQYIKQATNPVTYKWMKRDVPNSLFDIIDGYKKIFLQEPSNYQKGDLWFDDITKISLEDSDVFNVDHWEIRDDYVESFKIEQEEYHTVYILPNITEINRQTTSEIKKAIDEITLSISQTYTTVEQMEKYVDGEKQEIISTQETQNSQITLLQLTTQSIKNIAEETKSIAEEESQRITELQKKVETNQSSTEYQINVINQTLENGASKVVTETGYTFDDDGLNISKSGEEMENLITNTGMYVNRDDTNILTADNTGVNAINLHARQYLSVGTHSRWEDYQDGTGCFVVE